MSNANIKGPLVWIDCEMTGLDPKIDEIVEIAVVITDQDLAVVDPGIDLVVKASDQALEHMDDFVTNMHTSSGLIDEIASGMPLAEAEKTVLDYIKRFIPEKRSGVLAGNSVGQDRLFLLEYMPKLVDHLHYRIIDVSTIKELARRWYPRVYACAPKKNGGHRALADIKESIEELEYYRRALFPDELVAESGYYLKLAEQVRALGITEN